MDTLSNVLQALALKQAHKYFVGQPHNLGWNRIYGGQLVAHALEAASLSCPEHFQVHSLHCHFLASGSVNSPLSYSVESLRDGRTYLSRRVEGFQNNQLIFHALSSHQIPEEGLSYQDTMPDVPDPEELCSYTTILKTMIAKMNKEQQSQLPPSLSKRVQIKPAIEIRPVRPSNYLIPDSQDPERLLWLKVSDVLPKTQLLHQKLLAWISDFPLLGSALQPSGIPPISTKIKMASLDHSIWFYEPIRIDEWILFHMHAPKTNCGRGFVQGYLYTQKGSLIATVTQEGMLRLRS